MTNYVCSRTLTEAPGERLELVSGDAADFVRTLKSGRGKGLLGGGIPLFHRLSRQVDLELAECMTLPGGCVLLRYRLASPAI